MVLQVYQAGQTGQTGETGYWTPVNLIRIMLSVSSWIWANTSIDRLLSRSIEKTE